MEENENENINESNNNINDNNINNNESEINEEYKKEDDKDDEIITKENEELNEPPGPLEGKVIIITGETIVPKEYFRVLLARLGARVTFSVSSHITMLIHGNRLEDGRKFFEGIKYKLQ